MRFISTKESLPEAQKLESDFGTYHLIEIQGYGNKLAMYLEDEKGEKDWYSDYTSKIFREVVSWCEINKIPRQ